MYIVSCITWFGNSTCFFIIIWRCKNIINGDQDCKHSVCKCVCFVHTDSYTVIHKFVLGFQKEHHLVWEPLETLEYTATHRFLRNVNLVKWAYDDLQVPSNTSIWSKEYTTTYRSLKNVNLVKCVYHDLQEQLKMPIGQMNIRRTLKRQSGQMDIHRCPETLQNHQSNLMCIRWPTGSLETLIWSNAHTATYRNP